MKTTPLKTRFAPSPTGLMHFGNLRTALFNYLYAKRHNGIFLLRIEDTDTARSTEEHERSIQEDLKWMGLEWQEGPYYQSKRIELYENYYSKLEEMGALYPCFCTEAQLAIARKVQLQSGKPPRYPGTCRHLNANEIEQKKKAGIPYTFRFRIQSKELIEFEDVIKGPQRFDSEHIGDFIIRRGDGTASFMFCNAIDDAEMGVTHALRGDDHLTNTPRQILILKALKLPIPQYGHFPTILGPDGKPLSKRNGSRSIQELRKEGFHPLAIINYLARLGHTDSEVALQSLEALSTRFDLKKISQSPARYDVQQLMFWQKEAMRKCTWQECWRQVELFEPELKKMIPENERQNFIEVIQSNIVLPSEASQWAQAFYASELNFTEEDEKILMAVGSPFFETAIALLSDPNISFQSFVADLQQRTGLKGKNFFMPLRLIVTGQKEGPELAKFLNLMGYESVKQRFNSALKIIYTQKTHTGSL